MSDNPNQAAPQALWARPIPRLLDTRCTITKADCRAIWREVRRPMLDNGFRLVSVHSAYSLAVDPDGRGKQPLTEVVNGKKRPWTEGHSVDRLMRVTPLSANSGIVLDDGLVVFDIDPAKTAPAAAQSDYTVDILRLLYGDRLGALLRCGLLRLRPPASALILARSDPPMTKRKVKGIRGAVEVLATGQHFVCHGWHPRSLDGAPVRWAWHNDRAPWNTLASDLPVIPTADIEALMQRIGGSGVLGAPVARTLNTTTIVARGRAAAYPATIRLNELLAQHDGLVMPAVRKLIEEVGREGHGRHDAVVAVAGRLVGLGWSDERAAEFLTSMVNEHFQEGDWTPEIERALGHARQNQMKHLGKVKTVVWENFTNV